MIEARIKTQYQEIYGKPFPKDYTGEPMEATLLECSNKYNILYKVYGIRTPENTSKENSEKDFKEKNTSKDSKETNSERQYEEISSFRPSVLDNYITEEYGEEEVVEKYNKENPDKKIKICNLLFLSKESSESNASNAYEDKNHLMYIIDFEKFTKCHVCPNCGNYCLSASDNGCYNKKLFERHVAKCTGKTVPYLRIEKFLFQMFRILQKMIYMHIYSLEAAKMNILLLIIL
jgi:hypothetical protein